MHSETVKTQDHAAKKLQKLQLTERWRQQSSCVLKSISITPAPAPFPLRELPLRAPLPLYIFCNTRSPLCSAPPMLGSLCSNKRFIISKTNGVQIMN